MPPAQISAAECYPDRLKEPVIRRRANVAEKKLFGLPEIGGEKIGAAT
jgi:hypothetical protein